MDNKIILEKMIQYTEQNLHQAVYDENNGIFTHSTNESPPEKAYLSTDAIPDTWYNYFINKEPELLVFLAASGFFLGGSFIMSYFDNKKNHKEGMKRWKITEKQSKKLEKLLFKKPENIHYFDELFIDDLKNKLDENNTKKIFRDDLLKSYNNIKDYEGVGLKKFKGIAKEGDVKNRTVINKASINQSMFKNKLKDSKSMLLFLIKEFK